MKVGDLVSSTYGPHGPMEGVIVRIEAGLWGVGRDRLTIKITKGRCEGWKGSNNGLPDNLLGYWYVDWEDITPSIPMEGEQLLLDF